MAQAITSYTWHPERKRWRYSFAATAVLLAGFVWMTTHNEPDVVPCVLASFFTLIAVALLIEKDTRVDSDTRTIIREGRLFGRFRVWLWRHHLSEFTGVATIRHIDPDGTDTLFVGLRRRSGRHLAIRYFYAGKGRASVEAELIARSLSEITGLPLHEDLA